MKISAGILLYRLKDTGVEVFLVHPGGPFWKNKDEGAWSIPKGEVEGDEDYLCRAKKEFKEETDSAIDGNFIALTPIKQKSGKLVHAWAVAGDIDATTIKSNTFPMEWPPKSGRMIDVPEVDKADWFDIVTAKQKINAAQAALLDELSTIHNR